LRISESSRSLRISESSRSLRISESSRSLRISESSRSLRISDHHLRDQPEGKDGLGKGLASGHPS
jgi:hypothetical protein